MAVLVALVAAAFAVPLALRSGPAAHTVAVNGWAYLDQPLTGATVSIRTAGGRTVVRDRADATGPNGTLDLTAKVPPAFRVTVADGTAGGQIFTGRLVADVYNYGPNAPVIQVNPVTTLLAAYKDRHTDLSSAKAATDVARFLQLPSASVVRSDLRGNEQWFSSKAFMAQASAAGGIQPFVDQLVKDMDARPPKTHAFVGPAANGVGIDIASFVAQKVAAIALSHILQKGLNFAEPTDVDIFNGIQQIQTQLNRLQDSVNNVSQQLIQVSYDKWATDLSKINNDVTVAWSKYQLLAAGTKEAPGCDTPSGPICLKTEVTRRIDDLIFSNALTNLNSTLLGPPASTGAYRAWSNLIRSKNTFWGPAQSQQLTDYFDAYDVLQAQLIVLMSERLSDSSYNADKDTYTKNRAAQQALRGSVQAASVGEIDLRTAGGADHSVPAGAAMWIRDCDPWKCSKLEWKAADFVTKNGQYPVGAKGMYGFADWRLPTRAELTALIAGQSSPGVWLQGQWGDPVITSPCVKFPEQRYCPVWTSTQYVSSPAIPNCTRPYAVPPVLNVGYWTIAMDTGKNTGLCEDNPQSTWAVRKVTANEKYWL